MTNKQFWLYKRLAEVGKTRQDLANVLGVAVTRFSELEKQKWKFKVEHINKTAKMLEFDKSAFVDFLSGDITEEQLWQTKPFNITDQDMVILQAVKSAVGLQKQTEDNNDITKQIKISENER